MTLQETALFFFFDFKFMTLENIIISFVKINIRTELETAEVSDYSRDPLGLKNLNFDIIGIKNSNVTNSYLNALIKSKMASAFPCLDLLLDFMDFFRRPLLPPLLLLLLRPRQEEIIQLCIFCFSTSCVFSMIHFSPSNEFGRDRKRKQNNLLPKFKFALRLKILLTLEHD